MAVIPLQVASRQLDTGSVVQYPGGGEGGRALQGVGGELQQVADHFQAKQDQQDRFDAGVVDDELRQRLAETEAEAARNAPADGSGIHDSVYGQMDPATSKAVKPGAFDALFDEYAQRVPQSQRANFMATKEALRLSGSNRLAGVQYSSRQAYEQVQLTKSQDTLLNGILQSDPNDVKTFDAFKQNGLDRIANSGMSAIDKEKAAYNWQQSATKGLFQSMLEKDPSFAGKARAALGLAPPASASTGGGAVNTVVDRIIGVESGGSATAKNPNSSASGVGQFLDSTWVQTIRQHRPDIAAGKSADQIIALKSDPVLGREMTAAFTQDNADYLTNRGIQTTPGNIYLAHFLGPAGAVSVLKADPNASIASVVGQDVVRANGFLAGKTVSDTIAWSDKKMGGAGVSTGSVDPRFASLAPEDRLSLANQADVQYRQQQAAEKAQASADYTAYKDRYVLGIVQGQIADPAIISNDPQLKDGDKAYLLRSFNEQNKGAIQLQADMTALQDGSLSLDPYSSTDKTRADKLYTSASTSLQSPDQQAALASSIIQRTGVVPQPVINSLRAGLSSQNPGQVVAAAQSAQRIASFDPAVLGRRDGGSEVQKAADDFSYYVNKLNLPPEEAARRMIDNASPEKQRDRKALKPAADEFVKSLADVDLSAEFKEGGMFSGAPALGLDPMQEAGIKADFMAIAEDQFYSANGNADLAKNRAVQQMKTLYGVSTLSGSPTVVKYPPEKYWPKQTSSGGFFGVGEDPYGYAKTQLRSEVDEFSGRGPAGPVTKFEGTLQPGNIDLANRPQVKNPDGSVSTVRSMSFENDAGQEVLIPTVADDGSRILSNEEAMQQYGRTGKHLGIFDTPEHATAYAEALHKTQEQYYRGDLAIDPSTVRLVTTPETEADVKAGRLPGYAVMWADQNGNLQTIPGKVWRPDTTKMQAIEDRNAAKEQSDAIDRAKKGQDINKNIIEGVPKVLEGSGMQNNPIMKAPPEPAPKPQEGSNIPTDIPAPAENNDLYSIGSPL